MSNSTIPIDRSEAFVQIMTRRMTTVARTFAAYVQFVGQHLAIDNSGYTIAQTSGSTVRTDTLATYSAATSGWVQ